MVIQKFRLLHSQLKTQGFEMHSEQMQKKKKKVTENARKPTNCYRKTSKQRERMKSFLSNLCSGKPNYWWGRFSYNVPFHCSFKKRDDQSHCPKQKIHPQRTWLLLSAHPNLWLINMLHQRPVRKTGSRRVMKWLHKELTVRTQTSILKTGILNR